MRENRLFEGGGGSVIGVPVARNLPVTPEELLGRRLNTTEQKYSPGTIYVSGRKDYLGLGPRVAIVGTRSATQKGRNTARELAAALAREGVIIISGLARGIDTEAHEGAIESGGKTIAVLGTPLSVFYPPENRELQEKIQSQHLLVSQFPEGKPVLKSNFIMRNRTMALLCDASIIVEAGDSSGTLSQGWEALRLGRPLLIWHEVLERKDLEWPNKMIEFGARVLNDISIVLDNLPIMPEGLTLEII